MTDTAVDNQTDGETSTDEKNPFAKWSTHQIARYLTAVRRNGRAANEGRSQGTRRCGSNASPRSCRGGSTGCGPAASPSARSQWWPGTPASASRRCSSILRRASAAAPCGPTAPKSPEGSVLILSADDDVADTITPRLIAARAQIGRITIVKNVERENGEMHRFVLPRDVQYLQGLLETLGDVRLVVIDPLAAFLGEKSLANDADVLGILDPLEALAAEKNVAIVCSSHFGKGSAKRANHRFRGSIALTIHARSALVVVPHRERPGERLLALSKQSLGPPVLAMSFSLDPTTITTASGPIETIAIAWNDAPVAWTADEAVASEGQGGPARAEAMAFLSDALAQRPLPAGEVLKRAKEAGIAGYPSRVAREKLGVRSTSGGYQAPWVWSLPEKRA